MPRYRVLCIRTLEFTDDVEVEAENAADAEAKAVAQVKSYDPKGASDSDDVQVMSVDEEDE